MMSFPSEPGRNWSRGGRGGTLNSSGTGPGPYYVLAASGVALVGGNGGWASEDVNVRAVRGAVVGIQRSLNRILLSPDIAVTGRFNAATRAAVLEYQAASRGSLAETGYVDMETARYLFGGDIQYVVGRAGLGETRWGSARRPVWQVVWGLVNVESLFDPGSVGYTDPGDLGLGQINGRAHPDMSERERLAPLVALEFMVDYLEAAVREFGSLRDAVASYNLGFGGTRSWIADGRPDVWTPAGSSSARDVAGYVDRVVGGYETWQAAVSE